MVTEAHFRASVSKSFAGLNKNMVLLLNLSSLIVKAADLKEHLTEALGIILEGLRFFAGRIYLMDDSKESLSLVAWKGISAQRLERVGLYDSFTGMAALQRAFLVQRVADLKNKERKKLLMERGIKAVVCVPMMYGGEILGVINLSSNRTLKLRKGYVELLCAVGNQLAISIKCIKSLEEIKQKTLELSKEEEMRKFFTYCIAHDLKNPAGTIMALIKRVLDKKVPAEKLTLYLEQIHKAVMQIYNLVRDLNLYIVSKELPLNEEEVKIEELVEDIRVRYFTEIKERKIALLFKGNVDSIVGDREQIKRVLTNLVDNSLKYGGPNLRHIIISSEASDGWVVLRVTDDGVGIKEEEFPNLFDPFQRKSSAKDTEGSGLGLAIVRTIVERHGGRVWANRPENGGIEFCLQFPLKG